MGASPSIRVGRAGGACPPVYILDGGTAKKMRHGLCTRKAGALTLWKRLEAQIYQARPIVRHYPLHPLDFRAAAVVGYGDPRSGSGSRISGLALLSARCAFWLCY